MAKKQSNGNGLPPIWRRWKVRLTFISTIYGSVPADPELVAAWLNARKPRVKPAGGPSIEEINEQVLATLATEQEDEGEKSLLVFQRVDGKIVLRPDTFRAHLKDCAGVISAQYMGRVQGE